MKIKVAVAAVGRTSRRQRRQWRWRAGMGRGMPEGGISKQSERCRFSSLLLLRALLTRKTAGERGSIDKNGHEGDASEVIAR